MNLLKQVILVMLENRNFDGVLGYLPQAGDGPAPQLLDWSPSDQSTSESRLAEPGPLTTAHVGDEETTSQAPLPNVWANSCPCS